MKKTLLLLFAGLLFTTFVGNSQNSLFFDGDDCIVLPQVDELVGTGAKSFDLWIKAVDTANSMAQILQLGQDASGKKIAIRLDGGTYLRIEHGGGYKTGSATTLNDNNWHHVAITIPDNGLMQDATLYVDGVLEAASAGNTTAFETDTGRVWISRRLHEGDPDVAEAAGYWEGWMDELRLWNVELTAEQVAAFMDSVVCSATTTGLLVYFPMDEGADTIIYDKYNEVTGVFGYPDDVVDDSPEWDDDVPTIKATDCGPGVSIPKETIETSLRIYPNPASDYITIESTEPINSVSMVNLLGQDVILELSQTGLNEYTLPISHIRKGMYFLKVNNKATPVMIE